MSPGFLLRIRQGVLLAATNSDVAHLKRASPEAEREIAYLNQILAQTDPEQIIEMTVPWSDFRPYPRNLHDMERLLVQLHTEAGEVCATEILWVSVSEMSKT